MDRKKQRNEESDKFDIPVAVLDDVFYEKVELGDAFVSNVVQKTEISRLVRDLCSIFPLSNWAHLKRVKSQGDKGKQIQVIICQVNDLEGCPNPSLSALTERHGIETRGLEGLYTVRVPHKPPLTRSQYEEASVYWPVHFHEDKRISRLLNGTEIFTQKELAHIHSHMETAVKMAEIALQKQQLPVGAVIVDGRTNTVVAKSHDYRHGSSPLHHAAMTCVDLVARGQGGGAWDWSHDSLQRIGLGLTDIDFYSARIAGAQHDSREVSVTSKSEQEISSHRPAEENRKNSQGEATMSDQIVEESAGNQSEDAYLCTGYDLYTTREPCAMCAMSLVHSRIRRVFYGASHQNGALGTHYKLHAQKGLNHHYEVFRGVREEQCAKLLINT